MIIELLITLTMFLPTPGPVETKYPAFVNPYDPVLQGINCDSDCSSLANGRKWTEDDYGKLAACPPDLMGCYVTFTNDYSTAGPFLCSDTGGALLEPMYVEKFDKTVQHFDILWDLSDENEEMIPWSQLPWWNHAVFEEWEADCTYAYTPSRE